ncbi:hypothetical protein pb186bvf_008034 [Paramecium bursaria]
MLKRLPQPVRMSLKYTNQILEVDNLQLGSTVADIDVLQLCEKIYDYDHIWLTQLWTPSKFNYQNQINAQTTNNYKSIQNIKEYALDPALGTSSHFLQFQQQLKSVCYHIKFLGEFSFYVGSDSPLLYNKTRFLQVPYDQISNNYNPRYDNDGFIWAVDDFGRIMPNTAVWNLFSKIPLQDISDIIYRQIILQYNLDGIVFLKPSLGLYSFNNKFYNQELSFFGQTSYFKDFYVNFGLKFTDTQYYFMGGEDNFNGEFIFSNVGLQQLFKTQYNYDSIRQNANFSFDSVMHHNLLNPDSTTISSPSWIPGGLAALVDQDLPATQKSCFKVNLTASTFCAGGLAIKTSLQNYGYLTRNLLLNGEYANHGGTYHGDSILNFKSEYTFNCNQKDQIEVQFDPLNKTLTILKLRVILFNQIKSRTFTQRFQFMIILSTLRYFTFLGSVNQQLQISFPYYFSSLYKSPQASVKGDRNLLAISSNQTLQYAQIEPSINQFNVTRLNILIQTVPAGQMIYNKHIANIQLGWGAYMVFQNEIVVQHSDNSTYNNQLDSFAFSSNSLIHIIYNPNTKELAFYDTQSNSYNMLITRKIKNMNFCVAFNNQNSAFYLQY